MARLKLHHLHALLLGEALNPRREARQIEALRVPLMDKAAGHRAGSRVEVFIATPTGEIAAPLVKSQGDIPSRVGEVETGHAALPMTEPDNLGDIEHLAGVILDTGKQYQCDRRAFALDQVRDIFKSEAVLTGSRRGQKQRPGGIEAVEPDL